MAFPIPMATTNPPTIVSTIPAKAIIRITDTVMVSMS